MILIVKQDLEKIKTSSDYLLALVNDIWIWPRSTVVKWNYIQECISTANLRLTYETSSALCVGTKDYVPLDCRKHQLSAVRGCIAL
jgi:hypothetical protein